MSLQLMKERMKITGHTPREEMIRDGQNLLKEELEHDTSYSPTMYIYNPVSETEDRLANLRVYGRKNSSLNGNYMNFLTTYDNPIKIGDYIHDTKDDTYWLVYNSFNVNDIHYEGKLIQCNYLLRWQLSNGDIVQRWANIVSASKYDTGENGNSTIVLSSNNFTILIGYCEEGFELEGKRVFIDRKTIPEKVFKITRGDDILYDSGNIGSLLSFIADKTEFDANKDNQELRICDYIDIHSLASSNVKATISGNKTLRLNFPKTYTATLHDLNGNVVAWSSNYVWNVDTGIYNGVSMKENGDKTTLYLDSLNNGSFSFLLQVIDTNTNLVIGEFRITAKDVV